MKLGKLIVPIFVTLFFAGIIIGVFSLFSFTLGGLFILLGVEFTSYWALFLFFILFFVIGFIVEIVCKGFMLFVFEYVNNKIEAMIVQGLIAFAENLLCLFIVDFIVSSVTITTIAKIIIALFLVFTDLILDKQWKKVESKDNS